MKQRKITTIGFFLGAEILLLIASPLLEKVYPLLGTISTWLWFVLPGYLLTYLIKRPLPWIKRLPISFALAVGFNAPFSIVAILMRLSLNLYLGLSIIAFVASLLLYYFFAEENIEDAPDDADLDEEPRWVRSLLLVTLAAVVLFLVVLSLIWPPAGDDLAGLPLYTEVLAQGKIVGQEPFHGTGTPVTPRNELVVWGYQTILLARMGDIAPDDLLVGSRSVLIVMSFLSIYALISEWFEGRSFSYLVLIIWGLYLVGSLQFDGDGSNFVTRIFQDKFFGWFVIIPVLLVLFLWYVEQDNRITLALLAIGVFGIALVHPVTFSVFLILIAGYSILHLAFNPSKQEFVKFIWLGAALGLCLVIPVIQYIRYMGPMPLEQAGLMEAVEYSRYRMAVGRFRLLLLESGGFVLHPQVITQQFVFISLIASLFLVRDVREKKGVKLLIGSIVLLSALLYIPIFAFLVGKFVTPFLIWRLAWPYSLLALIVLSISAMKAIDWISIWLESKTAAEWLRNSKSAIILLFGVLITIPNFWLGFQNFKERLIEQAYTECARAEGALTAATEFAVGGAVNILASQKMNLCIPGKIGLANVIEYRGLGTVNRLPFEQVEASYQRVEDSEYFSNASRVDDRNFGIIERYDIDLVLLDRERMSMELQLQLIPEIFSVIFEDQNFVLFSVSKDIVKPAIVEANTVLSLRDWDSARREFSKILEDDPDDLLAAIGLSDALAGAGDLDGALAVLLEAEEKNPEKAVVQTALAETYLVLRDIQNAARHYQNAVKLAPERGQLYYSLGALQLLLGETQSAFSNYEVGATFVTQDDTARYYSEIADQLVSQARYAESVSYFEAANAINPSVDSLVSYAEALFQMGEYGKAIAACQAALKLNPWHYLPYFQIGRINKAQNNYQAAFSMFGRAIWLNPSDTDLFIEYSDVLQELFGVDEAVAELEGMVLGSRDLPGPHAGLVPLYIMQGDSQSALKQYEILETLLPRSSSIQVSRGFFLIEVGRIEEAEAIFQQAFIENPELISPSIGMATIMSLSRDVEEELEQRLQISKQMPLKAWPHISLAIAYNRLGRWEEALQEFEFAVALNPAWPVSHIALGDFYLSRGDWYSALKAFDHAADLGVQDSELLNKLARTYWYLGDQDHAKDYFLKAVEVNPLEEQPLLDLSRLYWQQGYAGLSMTTLDRIWEHEDFSLGEVSQIIDVYEMQGRLDQVKRIYDEVTFGSDLYSEFPLWADPELPLSADNEYVIGLMDQQNPQLISMQTLLREAVAFYQSQNNLEGAEAALAKLISPLFSSPIGYLAAADFYTNQGDSVMAFEEISHGLVEFPNSAELYHYLGELNAQAGAYENAKTNFEQAIQENPGYTNAYTQLSEIFKVTGDFDSAEAVLKAGIDQNHTSLDLYLALSELYVFVGDIDQAEQVLLTAADLAPAESAVLIELASIYNRRGKIFGAAELLNKALVSDQLNSEVYLAFGRYLNSRGEDGLAYSALQTSVNINLAGIRPRLEMGDYYQNSGQYNLAEKVYSEVIALYPGSTVGYNAMGSFYFEAREFDNALDNYKAACEIMENNIECILGQAKIMNELGRVDEALEYYNAALALAPNSSEVYSALADFYLVQGDLAMAAEILTLSVDKSTEKFKAYSASAGFYWRNGDFDRAEQDYLIALEYWPGALTYELELAQLMKQENKHTEAIRILENLAAKNSLTCLISLEIADSYSQQLKWDDAMRVYQEIIELDPKCVDAYQGVAQLTRNLGDTNGLPQIYEDAVEASPQNPRAFVNLGNMYANRMEYEAAESAYIQALEIDPGNINALLGLEAVKLMRYQEDEFEFVDLSQFEIGKNSDNLVSFVLLYQDFNQWEKADEYLQTLSETDDTNPSFWYAQGNQYAHALNWPKAKDAYLTSLRYSPDDLDAMVSLGETLIELEEYDQALEVFTLLTRYHPGKADGYLALSSLYSMLEDYDQAVVILETGISKVPSDSRLYHTLGQLYFKLSNLEAAKSIFQSGLEAVPGSPNLYSGLGDYYSWSINGLVDDLQQSEAVVWWYGYLLRRLDIVADELGPRRSPALENRRQDVSRSFQSSVVQLESVRNALVNAEEDFEAAREAYNSALTLNPGNEAALLGLARIEEFNNSLETAMDYYNRSAAANPNSIISLNRLGFAYLELGELDTALTTFERSVSLEPGEILGLVGRFRTLIEIGDYGVVGSTTITESAQFWWGNLVDRSRVSAFSETSLDPYGGDQEKINPNEIELFIDVPDDWSERQTNFDYSVVRTYISPDEHAAIQLIVYDDGKPVNRSLSLLFSLALLNETYTDSLYIESNEILNDRENLIWQAEEQGYRGVTGFTIKDGKLIVLTYMYDDLLASEYVESLDEIIREVLLGDPIYPNQ